MATNNASVFVKYLLSGCTPAAAKELLEQISVEEMVFQLASLPSEAFVPYTSDPGEESGDSTLDERYLGNLIIRTLDSLLDKRHYEAVFKNDQILKVIRDGISDANFYVKKLISKHLLKFIENGGKGDDVYEVVWNLLFEKEYTVFEDAAKSVCAPEGVDNVTLALRVMEFCTMAGKTNERNFEMLKNAGLYDQIFRLYMDQDILVRLNCAEILDSMVPLIKKLKFESNASRQFVRHALDMFTSKEQDPAEELIAGPLLRFFSAIVLLQNVLKEEEVVLFARCVADNIANNPKGNSVQYYSSLASFGSLYARGCLDQAVAGKFLDIVRTTRNEDALYACLESLQFLAQMRDGSMAKFVTEATESVVAALPRFPFSEAREACFAFLANALAFRGVTEVLVGAETQTKLLSTQESNYQTTLTKRELIRKFLARVEGEYGERNGPLPESTLRSLKAI